MEIPKKLKIIVGIVTIDRDSYLSKKLYNSILRNFNYKPYIIVVTRETDIKTINFWKDKSILITIPHYNIEKRHNYERISYKRSICMNIAKKNNFDAIWFLDSDIIPNSNTLKLLASTKKDICCALYKVKWCEKNISWY